MTRSLRSCRPPPSCHHTWQELKHDLQLKGLKGLPLQPGTYAELGYQHPSQHLVVVIDTISPDRTVHGRLRVYGPYGDYHHSFNNGEVDRSTHTVAWTDDIGLAVIAKATKKGLIGVRNSHEYGGSCFKFDLRPQP